MGSQDSSVDLLAQAILAQAQEEARKIRRDAEGSAQRIESDAEGEAAARMERAGLAEKARAARESASEIAAANAAARRRILEAREQLIERVFSEVGARLESVRRENSYSRILLALISEGVAELEGDAFVVSVAADDLDRAKRALTTSSPAKKIEVRADAQIRGGCVVRQTDGRCIYDNTFASIIQRHHLRLRATVAEVFWGKDKHWDQV